MSSSLGTVPATTSDDTLAGLRRRMAAMSGRPDQPSVEIADSADAALPLPESLRDLLPQKGIARGSVISCDGARSVLLAVIASVTGAGGQVGIVGMPQVSLLSAVEMGADLSRIATVPYPGADPVEVAAVLLDGMDLVILDLCHTDVAPSRSRVVMGRARKQASSLLVTGGAWPGLHARLEARVVTYRHSPMPMGIVGEGADARRSGYGRIGGMRLQVVSTVRGRRYRDVEIDMRTSGFGSGRQVELVRVADAAAAVPPVLAVAN